MVEPARTAFARLWTPLGAMGLVFALAVLVNAGILANGFAWDDHYLIVENPAVHGFDRATEWFTAPWSAGAEWERGRAQNALYWRPFTQATYALDWVMGGGSPVAFHATNLALHATASLLVVLLALALSGGSVLAGLVAGALFAVHPVHSEAVALATYRTTLLAGTLVLAGLVLHARGARHARWLVPLVWVMGLMAKEDAIVLPGLLLVVDLARGRHTEGWRWLLSYAPLAAIGVGYLALHAQLTGPAALDFFAAATPGETFFTMMSVYALYVRLMIVPWPLVPFYDWTILPIAGDALAPGVLAGLLLLLLTAAGFALGLLRPRRTAASQAAVLGCGLFLVALLPYSHLVTFFDAAGERFLYVASVAPCLVAGLAMTEPRARRLGLPLLVAVTVVFGALTVHRAPVFDSTESMLRRIAVDFPGSFNAHFELGRELSRAGRRDEAVAAFREAWTILPDLEVAALELAAELVAAAREDEARAFLLAERERLGERAPSSYAQALSRIDRGLPLRDAP